MARDSKELAEASKRDSSAMKIIAVLTTLFLPGTFIAVSSKVTGKSAKGFLVLIPNVQLADSLCHAHPKLERPFDERCHDKPLLVLLGCGNPANSLCHGHCGRLWAYPGSGEQEGGRQRAENGWF
jgi:hypothetical protein